MFSLEAFIVSILTKQSNKAGEVGVVGTAEIMVGQNYPSRSYHFEKTILTCLIQLVTAYKDGYRTLL